MHLSFKKLFISGEGHYAQVTILAVERRDARDTAAGRLLGEQLFLLIWPVVWRKLNELFLFVIRTLLQAGRVASSA